METLVNKIENILNNVLPSNTYKEVKYRKGVFGSNDICILFAVSDYNINQVRGQRPQLVSMLLNIDTMELKPQIFGCNGGQCIYRKPNLNDSKEKYLAMKSVKIPFKQPKKEEKNVLDAIERFAKNWLITLKENKEVLKYSEYVNYDEFFNS